MSKLCFWKNRKQYVSEQDTTQIAVKEAEKGNGPEEEDVRKLSEDVVWFKRLMAHNIRMPLAVIVGYGELLTSNSFNTREEELDCIKKICSNIDFLDTLTKVLLDDEQEDVQKQKEYFDILDCVREVAEYVSVIAKKAGIRITVNSSKNRVLFYGSRVALMRAFFNLIENSVRYMNRQGNIYFTVEETESEILVVYRDDGEGMRAEEAVHITELNFQGSNRKSGGHGIGMYLICETVEKQGGKLEVKTEQGSGMGVYMSFSKE